MKPAFSKYASAIFEHDVTGTFLASASDEELSEMFKEMHVSLAHKVELREAVAAWRADPQRVLFPLCFATAPAFLPLHPRAHLPCSPHPSRRCKPSNEKVLLKWSGSEKFGRRRSGSETFGKRRSGSEKFGKRRSTSSRLLLSRCCLPALLFDLLINSFMLQAAAASRIKGQPGIIEAAEKGNLSLVQDYLTVDPLCVGCRDGE